MNKCIFWLFCFFLFLDEVWAVTLNCPEIVSPREEFKVRIEDIEYRGIKAKYNFESGFIYQGISLGDSVKSYYDGVNGFSVGNVIGNNGLRLEIKIKIDNDIAVNKDYTLGLIDIDASDKEDRYVKLDDMTCKVRVLSDINTLDSLSIEGVSLSPKFDKNILSYQGVTKNEKIVIKGNTSDSGARIEGDIGEKNLTLGVNTFNVKVISARGSIREYKLYITRESKSNDVTLKSLKLSSGDLDFSRDVFYYLINVSNEVDNIDIEAIPNDDKTSIRVEKPEILVVGKNEIRVIVTAEDGTMATYVVVVNKKEKISNDATIKNLVIKNYKLDFKSNIYEYNLEIDGEDNLDIDILLNNDAASYNIRGNKDLANGSVIEIEVKAEDGSINTYKINISKLDGNNSNSISDYIGILPLVGFILLIIVVLIIKVIKTKNIKS